jgi:hypothetical protein
MTQISRELFEQQRRPRFGTANPERMQLAFWEWMIRGEESIPAEGEGGLAELGFIMRDGKLKSGYGPYRARDLFKVPLNRDDGPIWTFERYVRTRTELPDGRVVCIGGEHEDFYDPDFCIYNDVVVFGPKDEVEIYGYPKEVFPPTDFHTATCLADRIIIVGNLGYVNERRPDHTPVYALDLSEYHMSEINTSGQTPGWISEHEASLDAHGVITIRGGKLIQQRDGEQQDERNFQDYALDVRSRTWERLTDRKCRRFLVRQQAGRPFILDRGVVLKDIVPSNLEQISVPGEEFRAARVVVKEVPILIIIGVRCVEVIIEGELPGDLSNRFAEQILANTQAAIGHDCVLEEG